MARKKVLFAAEAVSLAHVARPTILAESLDPAAYDIIFASNGQFPICAGRPEWTRQRLESISPETFLHRLAAGSPVYTEAELMAYVEADRALLERQRPDAVVSDFRLSMAIAARQLGLPLFAICNAYWSPHATNQQVRAPDLAPARLLGFGLMDRVFATVWPIASRYHCRAINRVRARQGLGPVRSLRDYYCDGDVVLYADTPSLVPTRSLPASHHYIGPIVWSPNMALPAWWEEAIAQPRPKAYVTLGSTGNVELLPTIVAACREAGLVCLVATAGRRGFDSVPPDVYAAPFLPGSTAAAAADLVICNGGNPTASQALQAGKPVLGVCSNLDQVLNMMAVQRAGAGVYLRAGELTSARARQALAQLLQPQSACRQTAQVLQREFEAFDPREHFPHLLTRYLG
jgi:UDP:flavonoid glycosyltransferase YjiC (YdhE family)